MKRKIIVGMSILAVAALVEWRLARQPESSTGLQDIDLIQHSEHASPGPTDELAGIRIRLSPSDFDDAGRVAAIDVPRIALAAD